MSGLNISYFVDYIGEEKHYFFSYFNDNEQKTTSKKVESYLIGLLTLLAALTNICIILFIIVHRTLHSVTNLYLVNLCAVSLVTVPCSAYSASSVMERSWKYGESACKYSLFSLVMAATVAMWTMSVIAIDRQRLIAVTVKKPLTNKQALAIMVVIWIASSLATLPTAILSQVRHINLGDGLHSICTKKTSKLSLIAVVVALTISFVIPLIILIVCYKSILTRLRSSKLQLAQYDNIELKAPNKIGIVVQAELSGLNLSSQVVLQQVVLQNKRKQQFKNLVLTLIIMVILFFTFWLPCLTITLWIQFDCYLEVYFLSAQSVHIGVLCLNMNAFITPVFYCFSNRNMRDLLRKYIKRKEASSIS